MCHAPPLVVLHLLSRPRAHIDLDKAAPWSSGSQVSYYYYDYYA